MRRFIPILPLLALVLLLSAPRPATACPTCNAGVAADSDKQDESDGANLALAYNVSVYLLVGMPYFLLGTVSFLVYRGFKDKARVEQLSAGQPRPADGGSDDVLSNQSPGIRP
jgi:hypothetical protein